MTVTVTIKRAAAAGFWGLILVIGFLSLQPVENLPDVQIWDKIQHLVAYGALAFCGLVAYPRRLWQVIGFTVLYGLAIEFAQGLVPGRVPSFGDVIANTLGGMMVLVAFRVGLLRRLAQDKSA